MTTGGVPALTAAEQIFKDVIWTPLIQGGETWLETTLPLLNLPVLKEIDEEIIQLVSDALFGNFIQFIDVTAIGLVDPIQQATYATACENLSVILTEKGVTSVQYQTARAKTLADMAAATHFNGV